MAHASHDDERMLKDAFSKIRQILVSKNKDDHPGNHLRTGDQVTTDSRNQQRNNSHNANGASASQTQTHPNIHRILTHRAPDNLDRAFWGQLAHHRHKRRTHVAASKSDTTSGTTNPSFDWRQRRHLVGDAHATAIGTWSLSNCHTIMWTGEIQLGSPPQSFAVDST